jgi:hypothetical protein
MSDDNPNQARQNYSKRLAEEYRQLSDPVVKGQMALDAWWEQKLLRRARVRGGENPATGEYDPMRRFMEEMDYAQQEADARYSGRRR